MLLHLVQNVCVHIDAEIKLDALSQIYTSSYPYNDKSLLLSNCAEQNQI